MSPDPSDPKDGNLLPLWVWIFLGLAFLWALYWFVGLSLPAHWRG